MLNSLINFSAIHPRFKKRGFLAVFSVKSFVESMDSIYDYMMELQMNGAISEEEAESIDVGEAMDKAQEIINKEPTVVKENPNHYLNVISNCYYDEEYDTIWAVCEGEINKHNFNAIPHIPSIINDMIKKYLKRTEEMKDLFEENLNLPEE